MNVIAFEAEPIFIPGITTIEGLPGCAVARKDHRFEVIKLFLSSLIIFGSPGIAVKQC